MKSYEMKKVNELLEALHQRRRDELSQNRLDVGPVAVLTPLLEAIVEVLNNQESQLQRLEDDVRDLR